MAITSGQVSVTSSGVAVVAAANTNWPAGDDDSGPTRCVVITNGTGAIVYLGASGVTTGTGLALGTSASVTLWLYPDEAIYGIVASTSSTVSYIESGS